MADYTVKTSNIDLGTKSPASARPDLYDNWEAIGKISTDGTADAVVKTDATGKIKALGGAAITGAITITGDTIVQLAINEVEATGSADFGFLIAGVNKWFVSGSGDSGAIGEAWYVYNVDRDSRDLIVDGDNGYITAQGIYANTSASAANVYVDSNGLLHRSTSSLKYKENISEDIDGDLTYRLRPVSYNSINEDDDKRYIGFIAEEVQSIEPRLVELNDSGDPDALHYSQFVSLLTKTIQDQKVLIDSLEQRISDLERK